MSHARTWETAPKESIVIPNAVRNLGGRDVAELRHICGIVPLFTLVATASLATCILTTFGMTIRTLVLQIEASGFLHPR